MTALALMLVHQLVTRTQHARELNAYVCLALGLMFVEHAWAASGTYQTDPTARFVVLLFLMTLFCLCIMRFAVGARPSRGEYAAVVAAGGFVGVALLPLPLFHGRIAAVPALPFEYPVDTIWALGRLLGRDNPALTATTVACFVVGYGGCGHVLLRWIALFLARRQRWPWWKTIVVACTVIEGVCLFSACWAPVLFVDQVAMRWATVAQLFLGFVLVPVVVSMLTTLIDGEVGEAVKAYRHTLGVRRQVTRLLFHEIRNPVHALALGVMELEDAGRDIASLCELAAAATADAPHATTDAFAGRTAAAPRAVQPLVDTTGELARHRPERALHAPGVDHAASPSPGSHSSMSRFAIGPSDSPTLPGEGPAAADVGPPQAGTQPDRAWATVPPPRGAVHALRSHIGRSVAALDATVNVMATSIHSIRRLMDVFHGVDLVETGGFAMELQPFSTTSFMHLAQLRLAATATLAGVELSCEILPGVPDRVLADFHRLLQVGPPVHVCRFGCSATFRSLCHRMPSRNAGGKQLRRQRVPTRRAPRAPTSAADCCPAT